MEQVKLYALAYDIGLLSLKSSTGSLCRVTGIILRGICLMRPSEIQWMYGGGAGNLAPAVRLLYQCNMVLVMYVTVGRSSRKFMNVVR